MKKIVILNDTTPDCHYGCSRVISNLNALIEEFGGKVIHSLKIDKKIDNPLTKEYLLEADIVIINGEGTFHHGAKRAYEMLQLVAKLPVKKYLVNATYDSNPNEFSLLLKNFDGVTVRETKSQQQLSQCGIHSIVLPDLSLYSNSLDLKQRRGYLYGDSVNFRLAWKIHQLFQNREGFSVNRICYTSNRWKQVNRYILKGIRKFDFTKYKTRNLFVASTQITDEEYHMEVARAEGIITGRYHAICYAINSYTPFLAIGSNSHKIEGLMEDIGLDDRSLQAEQLTSFTPIFSFSEIEIEKIDKFLTQGRKGIRTYYQSILS
ncbi:polysaccharide pyruvyl transferase family protein [Vibrio maerlii]|uniref:polysaccharide pyruvyl transferase family protein n=1 Tax=Vibrio maerlii TaxID=2231648 RepID=UPI000E3C4D4C|nr:polysaccharide pyruvyl transferase family protein [Vibrio maerlii]